jgi:hypothetical protein
LSARRLTPVRFQGRSDSSNGAVFGIAYCLLHSYLNPVANCSEMHSNDCRECVSPDHSLLLFLHRFSGRSSLFGQRTVGTILCWISWSRHHTNLQTSEVATDQADVFSRSSDKCTHKTNHMRPDHPECQILCHLPFQFFVSSKNIFCKMKPAHHIFRI